jgi:Tol biopolymer transport system component
MDRIALIIAAWAFCAAVASATDPEFGLLFSVRTWEGEYASKDIPGGVETTPVRGAIYSIASDGSGLKKLVEHGPLAEYPVVSPDNRWIYFQSNAGGHHEIYRCRFDGTDVVSLTPPERLTKQLKGASEFVVKSAYGISLSADGGKMVFTVHDGASGKVVLAKTDGTEPELVAPELGYAYMARLGPRNDRIVFSGPAKGYRLISAELPAGKTTILTPEHPDCYVPQFTPDGATIVFIRRDGDIYRVDADGKNLSRLTEGNRYVEFKLSDKDRHGSTDGPDILPDGKQVAFVGVADGIPNVFAMNMDGTNRRQITKRKSACGRVRWSPDGKQIAFVSFERKYPQLFVTSTEGGEPTRLTNLDAAVYFVTWYQRKPVGK